MLWITRHGVGSLTSPTASSGRSRPRPERPPPGAQVDVELNHARAAPGQPRVRATRRRATHTRATRPGSTLELTRQPSGCVFRSPPQLAYILPAETLTFSRPEFFH